MTTEQPDTAKIRRWYSSGWRGGKEIPELIQLDVLDLLAALDAARAELMDQSDRRMDAKFYADPELLVRAEAAEARIAELEAPFHRVRPRPEGTCHRNLHYPPANSECCWDYR